MIDMEGEITQTTVPPNMADQAREVTIWIEESRNEIEITLRLEAFQKHDLKVGDKLSIKIDKKLDFDKLAQDLFKMGK